MALACLYKRASRLGLKHKEKRKYGAEKNLVSFSQSKFSHFSNKNLMSCWNNTLLSAGTGWNFRSVSLLLGHIQPVAIENTACKAALCCEEIVLLVAVGFGLARFTFTHKVGFTNSNIPLFHHSFWFSCLGVCLARPAAYCWLDRVRKTARLRMSSHQQYSTHQCTSLIALPKHLVRRREKTQKKEERIKSYLYVVEAFCRQSASKDFLPCPHSPCQIVIEPSWKSKKPSTHSLWHQLPLFVSLSNTEIHAHFILKRRKNMSAATWGLSKDIPLNKLSYIQPPLISSLTDFILC